MLRDVGPCFALSVQYCLARWVVFWLRRHSGWNRLIWLAARCLQSCVLSFSSFLPRGGAFHAFSSCSEPLYLDSLGCARTMSAVEDQIGSLEVLSLLLLFLLQSARHWWIANSTPIDPYSGQRHNTCQAVSNAFATKVGFSQFKVSGKLVQRSMACSIFGIIPSVYLKNKVLHCWDWSDLLCKRCVAI